MIHLGSRAQQISRQDSLRGAITPERAWWDLLHYDIDVEVDIPGQSLTGKNTIRYKVLEASRPMQVDLMDGMRLIKAEQNGSSLPFSKEENAYLLQTPAMQPGEIHEVTLFFQGKPRVSTRPPWDPGFVWVKDRKQKDFVANANQATGPALWLPSKNHPYDEPDQGMDIRITAEESLVPVANGRLVEKTSRKQGKNTYHWQVTNPINGYGININIGDYVHFGEKFEGEKGVLDCDYYVLSYNLDKAKTQFRQAAQMLKAFEHWFGPYPFYEDSFKLVEVPYLGMEHQSSVTYGNGYRNGFHGSDQSNTGWGMKFDFIIIHEAGHEWFANNITNKDVADMWMHESFTTYSEVLYLDYTFGKQAGNEYLVGYRSKVQNDRPIIGPYNVYRTGSTDMYIKGAAMIHTLRQVINDDEAFRQLLRGINRDFYHQTLSSAELEAYISEKTGLDLAGFFEQYLRTTKVPELQYTIKNGVLSYRYRNTVENFNIPLRVFAGKEELWLHPGQNWQTIDLSAKDAELRIDENFYVVLVKK